MYTDIKLKIKTDDYELLRIQEDLCGKGYVSYRKRKKGTKLLLVCTLLETEDELMMNKEGYYVIDTLDSIIREAPINNRLYINYPVGCLLFICEVDNSDIRLEVKSNYVTIRQMSGGDGYNPSIVLPQAWENSDVCIIPYNTMSVEGDKFTVDTMEVIFRHTKEQENRSYNTLTFRKRFNGMMTLILKIP